MRSVNSWISSFTVTLIIVSITAEMLSSLPFAQMTWPRCINTTNFFAKLNITADVDYEDSLKAHSYLRPRINTIAGRTNMIRQRSIERRHGVIGFYGAREWVRE